jgi:hypothetical protein
MHTRIILLANTIFLLEGNKQYEKRSPNQRWTSSFLLATDCNILVGQQAILTTVPGQNPVVVGDVVIYVVGRGNNITIHLRAISVNEERRSKEGKSFWRTSRNVVVSLHQVPVVVA